ncbi:MAG TPA: hypothetical protein VH575_28155 [Gemmataceae bacterium]|jgi:hypothetical protein
MPSKPPRLAPPHVSSTPWWVQPPADRPKTPLVNISAIVAAATVSFAVVVGVLAWIAMHPGKPPRQAEPALTLAVLPAPPAVVAEPPAPPLVPIPAVHRPNRADVLVNHIPRDEGVPPLLPPPTSEARCTKPPPVAEAPPTGETYGTQVLFLNNPAVAEETAMREKKLLFVMHISGNFEDSCFT